MKYLSLPEEYPLFDVSDANLVFSNASGYVSDGGYYLDYYRKQTEYVPAEYQDKASELFFRGGTLQSIGLKAAPGFDETKIIRALKFLLSSWSPKHEEKIATVGFALMKWCQPCS